MGGGDDNSFRLLFGCRLSRLPNCGGNWNNTSNAGVFNVNLNNVRGNANGNIGFRSALLSYARGALNIVRATVREDKGACLHDAKTSKNGYACAYA